ncbi:helix-turn-helix transcriptional regulator [Pseudomonas sp. L5B5]|uniref:helix-turn-helix transcriptional regulator n=1 Tax=Pseudomonas sp. L5B5 TaxID=2883205 RepID=UPI001CFB2356|nr:helix-turn-helix transcriptional regulator [Pseudomonas sp. L5B5]UCZ84722.1 helix-turn-helix transcriptional regulator [Pseudomonas sp. L5B5]
MQLTRLLAKWEVADWHQMLARLLENSTHPGFPDLLSHSLQSLLAHDNVVIKSYRPGCRPQILYEDYPAQHHERYIARYLDDIYRLDPVSCSIVDGRTSGILRINPRTCQLHGTDYYRHYYQELDLADEIDVLVPADARTTLVMSIGRRSRRPASTRELQALHNVYPILQHLLRSFSEQHPGQAGPAISPLEAALATFAEDLLTPRERQVVRLMLQGNPGKLIARHLGISHGTVKVHRRNIYARLSVSSQMQLCDLFLKQASRPLAPP